MRFARSTAESIVDDYRREGRRAFCHTAADVQYVLDHGALIVRECRSCVWRPRARLFVSDVSAGDMGLSIATRLPDIEETPGPTIVLPYYEEAET